MAAPPVDATVLIVDDDATLRKVLGALLGQAGIASVEAGSGHDALLVLQSRPVDAVLADLRMPEMGGMELVSHVARGWPDVPVVMLTAHGTVPLAVEAMKRGAADFLLKPFDREEVLFVLQKALALGRGPTEASAPGSDFIGQSAAMRRLSEALRRCAATSATVLIRGETGTGKEVVARAIHEQSPRSARPLVKVNCAALPEALLESELFGHEKGAFTGATSRKPGRVELAAGGTLFLDEIGDVPLATQVKLLRLLQEREIERVGGVDTIAVDVRFIAATHRPLEKMVEDGEFREDLFYRLNVIPIEVPALRERPGDIAELARHFAQRHCAAHRLPARDLEPGAIERLEMDRFAGNVRQLSNLIERLVVLGTEPRIGRADVERELAREAARRGGARAADVPTSRGASLSEQRHGLEREAVTEALARARNNRTLAARLLGISRRTLYNKLKELGLA
jgi:two-component system, NtrC family, response regulator AtoC